METKVKAAKNRKNTELLRFTAIQRPTHAHTYKRCCTYANKRVLHATHATYRVIFILVHQAKCNLSAPK